MDISERERIVKEEFAYLPNGLRCHFAGWLVPGSRAGIHSHMPGSHSIPWNKIPEILDRPDRMIKPEDGLWRDGSMPWLGLVPSPEDFISPEYYDAVASGPLRWW